jgi:putative nucleotidyltransferase with HDIG domain
MRRLRYCQKCGLELATYGQNTYIQRTNFVELMIDPFSNPAYRPLSADAVNLLPRVSAPPRLIAHLVLVHDVASRLVERLLWALPELRFDGESVLFGAAIHDLGKTMDTIELVQPGKAHEKRGVELLINLGIAEDRSRFAYTHGNSCVAQQITLEHLLVALADNCWKGKRLDELETKTVELLSSLSGKPAWDFYASLDDILSSFAADADTRLTWQAEFGNSELSASNSANPD